jgi:enoyl-[acyl-carrier protein] reductase I
VIAVTQQPLSGKKGLVLGIANEHSLAYGCAKAFRALGAELAVTYLNLKAKPFIEPLAKEVEGPIFLPVDVREPQQLEAMFEAIAGKWGKLDFALHAIASAPKEDLHGRLIDCSRDGFLQARKRGALSRLRARPACNPRARHLRWTGEDASGVRARPLR